MITTCNWLFIDISSSNLRSRWCIYHREVFVERVNLPWFAPKSPVWVVHELMSLGVNYDTLNWQFSNDHGNTLIREKDKQKQTHLYFHRRAATESRETCKMDAPFPPQGNYVPSALVCFAQGRFVFRVVDVELRALNWHNPWQIVIDGRKINHMAKASGQLLSESKMNTWRAYHQPKLQSWGHNMI